MRGMLPVDFLTFNTTEADDGFTNARLTLSKVGIDFVRQKLSQKLLF